MITRLLSANSTVLFWLSVDTAMLADCPRFACSLFNIGFLQIIHVQHLSEIWDLQIVMGYQLISINTNQYQSIPTDFRGRPGSDTDRHATQLGLRLQE
jgi:hypothetical protein